MLGQHTHTVGLNSRPFWVQSCQVECLIGPVERIPSVILVGFIRTTSVRLLPPLASVITDMLPLIAALTATCHHYLHFVGRPAFAARPWSASSHALLYLFYLSFDINTELHALDLAALFGIGLHLVRRIDHSSFKWYAGLIIRCADLASYLLLVLALIVPWSYAISDGRRFAAWVITFTSLDCASLRHRGKRTHSVQSWY